MSAPDGATGPTVVLGGTGFLGRRIVRHLLDHGFEVRSASRNPQAARRLFEAGTVEPVRVDARDEASLAAGFSGCAAVVNAISLYVERGGETFDSIHVDAAARVARTARRVGARQLVHISGIGSNPDSQSDYIRARGRGEAAVREAFPAATLIRSAVMVAQDDSFLTTITRLVRLLPVYPLFGDGKTRLQPVHVEDVGEAVARVLCRDGDGACYELAGPQIFFYRDLVEIAARHAHTSSRPLPVPFALWHMIARLAKSLPGAPLTPSQVELMQHDNVADRRMPGFEQLGIKPRAIEGVFSQLQA